MLVLGGIIIFFIIEKTLGYISQYSEHQSHGHHGHGHSHGTRVTKDKSASDSSDGSDHDKDNAKKAVVSSDKDGEKKDERRCHIQPGAILSLMADAAHNFTDGLFPSAH